MSEIPDIQTRRTNDLQRGRTEDVVANDNKLFLLRLELAKVNTEIRNITSTRKEADRKKRENLIGEATRITNEINTLEETIRLTTIEAMEMMDRTR